MTKEHLEEEINQFYEKLDSGEDKRMTENSAWAKTLNKIIELIHTEPEHNDYLKHRLAQHIVQKHKTKIHIYF